MKLHVLLGATLALALPFAAGCGGGNGGTDAGGDAGGDVGSDIGSGDTGSGDGGGGDAAVDAPTCTPTTPPADPLETMRHACAFQAGAHASDTVGDVAAARAAITHVIVVMQENHSLDNMFGMTGHGIEGIPLGASNVDSNGNTVLAHHETNACTPNPGAHQWGEMHTAWNNGAMDGFALAAGGNADTAMGYYDDTDHPFYTWLATTFSTSDHYFADVLAGTWPNREYLLQGSRYGSYFTYLSCPPPDSPTLFDQLNTAGVGWGEYVLTGDAFEGALCYDRRDGGVPPQVKTYDDFVQALGDGSLPPVAFVDLGENGYDEHPPSNVHVGEDKVRELVALAFQSPLWAHTALIVTYDEGGGFYDHMPPPTACPPDNVGSTTYNDQMDTVYGIRVPFMLVSPYARPGYVSHRVHSHASVLRFIEALHDLPALTARDANSAALLDMFDFGCPAFAAPPAAASVPAAGTGTAGCP